MSVGIAAGILVAIFVAICGAVWKFFKPRIRKVFLQEPDINGSWRTKFEDNGKERSEEVNLNQRGRGRKVSGHIVLKSNDPAKRDLNFEFKGTFKHLSLICTYQATDRTNYERGAFVLRYSNDGTFTGKYVFTSKESDNITASKYEWFPKAHTK